MGYGYDLCIWEVCGAVRRQLLNQMNQATVFKIREYELEKGRNFEGIQLFRYMIDASKSRLCTN